MSKPGKLSAIRFDDEDEKAITDIAARTGLTRSEVLRRSLRLMCREITKEGSAWKVLEGLQPPIEPPKTLKRK